MRTAARPRTIPTRKRKSTSASSPRRCGSSTSRSTISRPRPGARAIRSRRSSRATWRRSTGRRPSSARRWRPSNPPPPRSGTTSRPARTRRWTPSSRPTKRRRPSCRRHVHTLLFLDPGHFHAALTLRVPHPAIGDEIFVYAPDGVELRDFLALVERFNRRSEEPTRWRPTVLTSGDPLARLVTERRGDVVVLAGRNGGKARAIRRLHDAGFHVLADKPWLVEVGDLEDVRQSLGAPPLAWEIMTGRHDLAARLMKRLVDLPDVFGQFSGDGLVLELESIHHLEKLVDGMPLRRPTWYFDVRVQGSGAVDIPTHLVDQTQWLTEGAGRAVDEAPKLLSARAWSTRVPAEAFQRITGEPAFPSELQPFVADNALEYRCNAELSYQVSGVTARVGARWDLVPPPGEGDRYRAVA